MGADSIVVGTDGSEAARDAVGEAVRLARALGAPLDVVAAYEPARREAAESALREAAAQAGEAEVSVATYAREGDPADAVLDVAEERGARLVVVGHKGQTGARRFLLGSVPTKVAHHAPCSVLIVRTG